MMSYWANLYRIAYSWKIRDKISKITKIKLTLDSSKVPEGRARLVVTMSNANLMLAAKIGTKVLLKAVVAAV